MAARWASPLDFGWIEYKNGRYQNGHYRLGEAPRDVLRGPPSGRAGGSAACVCRPSFQAQVWWARDRKTFPTVADALAWRQAAKVSVRTGHLRVPSAIVLAEAAEDGAAQRHAQCRVLGQVALELLRG